MLTSPPVVVPMQNIFLLVFTKSIPLLWSLWLAVSARAFRVPFLHWYRMGKATSTSKLSRARQEDRIATSTSNFKTELSGWHGSDLMTLSSHQSPHKRTSSSVRSLRSNFWRILVSLVQRYFTSRLSQVKTRWGCLSCLWIR